MIPEEDLPPRWIRDYGSLYNLDGDGHVYPEGTGPGIRADLPTMQECAAALRNNVDGDYVPHAMQVFQDMTVPTGPVNAFFAELHGALQAHQLVQQATIDNVANHGNGTSRFAEAATTISTNYQNTDAYAAARVQDVQETLGTTPPPTTPGTDPAQPGTDPTVAPTGDA